MRTHVLTWGMLLLGACHGENPVLLDAGSAEDAGSAHGSADAGAPVSGPYDTCQVDSDCAWGEIGGEIRATKDCICLYGCPYIPLSKATVERRAAQHEALCDPRRDGKGEACGIDDCAVPGVLKCTAGTCGKVVPAQ